MAQGDLERELVGITGESLTTVRHRGFSLVEPPTLEPLMIDWDEVDAESTGVLPAHGQHGRAA